MRIQKIVVTFILVAIPILTHAGLFGASNYAECILKYMPDTSTQQAAVEVRKYCLGYFPNAYDGVEKASTFFGSMTDYECYQKHVKWINTMGAKSEIKRACKVLY